MLPPLVTDKTGLSKKSYNLNNTIASFKDFVITGKIHSSKEQSGGFLHNLDGFMDRPIST